MGREFWARGYYVWGARGNTGMNRRQIYPYAALKLPAEGSQDSAGGE
ncbi:MAG: hypothetical protein LBH85_09260 [Treponema sp.]|nr:hypothetical protein [Treponema sp.]